MTQRPEFQLDDGIFYFNHAAVSPWPIRTCEAVKRFSDENLRMGSKNYLQWMEIESELRRQLQWLINAPSADDIALLKNTSEGLSVVAHGLQWNPGDNIVIPIQEFPSNRIVWQSLATQGVEVQLVDINNCDQPEQALIKQINEHTRLLACSAVQYANGLRMDLDLLGEHCKQHGILFCVDAIQQLGALPFDVQTCHADFVVADAHKWMLGPEGIALFYCSSKLREQLELHQYGWHMVENQFDFETLAWEPAHSARRFECGSSNMLGIHALHASMSLFQELGMDAISGKIKEHSHHMIDLIDHNCKLELLSPRDENRLSGIVTFKHHDVDSNTLHKMLSENGVICVPRGGGIRFSPHFYTSSDEITQVFKQFIP